MHWHNASIRNQTMFNIMSSIVAFKTGSTVQLAFFHVYNIGITQSLADSLTIWTHNGLTASTNIFTSLRCVPITSYELAQAF